MGRTTYTESRGAKVCEAIACGASVRAAIEGTCELPTFFRWLSVHEELRNLYARARETRADSRFESIDDILAELKSGAIDPATARVMIDTVKWQAGKEKARVYGDVSSHRLVDKDGNDRSMLAEFDRLVATDEDGNG